MSTTTKPGRLAAASPRAWTRSVQA
jgi:hypothetical protein